MTCVKWDHPTDPGGALLDIEAPLAPQSPAQPILRAPAQKLDQPGILVYQSTTYLIASGCKRLVSSFNPFAPISFAYFSSARRMQSATPVPLNSILIEFLARRRPEPLANFDYLLVSEFCSRWIGPRYVLDPKSGSRCRDGQGERGRLSVRGMKDLIPKKGSLSASFASDGFSADQQRDDQKARCALHMLRVAQTQNAQPAQKMSSHRPPIELTRKGRKLALWTMRKGVGWRGVVLYANKLSVAHHDCR
ncbi:hypothetical protein AG1IA_05960 [Rhizoctonia solani AG-1 IA]|uniref:Uncharacterized protein n=1 Tax=Thanatephorus cucumeris (strain AG1-IA) TaxID=983506 RepID=L8WTC6_THACA|nr:hypothetical protein AG1IA_05960 [Rhizoctonia solani AG-1 IA]